MYINSNDRPSDELNNNLNDASNFNFIHYVAKINQICMKCNNCSFRLFCMKAEATNSSNMQEEHNVLIYKEETSWK